jgi:hypothetical protein
MGRIMVEGRLSPLLNSSPGMNMDDTGYENIVTCGLYLGMTQQECAAEFGFSVNTLRHWEQGKRQPEGPTRAYLLVIDRAPDTVRKVLRAA